MQIKNNDKLYDIIIINLIAMRRNGRRKSIFWFSKSWK